MIINKDLAIEDGNINAQDRQRWEKGLHCCSCTHGSLVDSKWKCDYSDLLSKDCLSYFHPVLFDKKYPEVGQDEDLIRRAMFYTDFLDEKEMSI